MYRKSNVFYYITTKIKDKIEFPGVTIIIEKMHKNRIELLRLIIHEMKEEEEGEEKHQ